MLFPSILFTPSHTGGSKEEQHLLPKQPWRLRSSAPWVPLEVVTTAQSCSRDSSLLAGPAKPSLPKSDSYLALGLSPAQILGLENTDCLQNTFKAETTRGNV